MPVARARLGVFAASATIAGLAGALGVELAQVADPSSYGPVLSFELFVAVILGGARLPLGPVVGLAVISGFKHLAEEIGGLRGLPPGRLEEMLTGYGMLLVLGLGGAGLLPAARVWWRSRIPPRHAPRAASQGSALAPIEHPEPLQARGLSKHFGSLMALDDLDLDLEPGKVHALIGPNGSGKTTALRTLVGELGAGRGHGPHRLVEARRAPRARARCSESSERSRRRPSSPISQCSRTPWSAPGCAGSTRGRSGPCSARRRHVARTRVAETKAVEALTLVGLTDPDRPAAELSAHEQRLLMLAAALATQPRVLLLDEPAAGASAAELDSLAELLDELRASGLALLVIEHNLRFVRRVADQVTVLEAGKRDLVGHARRGRGRRGRAHRVPGTAEALVIRLALVLAAIGGARGRLRRRRQRLRQGADADDRRQCAVLEDAVRRRDDRGRRGAGRGDASVDAKGVRYKFQIKRYDTGLSARTAVANVRRAIADGAVAIVDEGTGVDASWRIARDADGPLAVTYQGGEGLIDPIKRPNVFRVAPTDHGMAFRLAEYLIPKKLKVALDHGRLVVRTGGREGARQVVRAGPGLGRDRGSRFPRARPISRRRSCARSRAGATALLVWAQPTTIAGVISAARSSGWDVPVYTPPTGEDPLVRQQLAQPSRLGGRADLRVGQADRRGRRGAVPHASRSGSRSSSACSPSA